MLKDLVLKNRSYRGYDESRRITREEMLELVDLARLVPSAANRLPLRYHISSEKAEVDAVQALTLWAGALAHLNLPYEGHRPTGFVTICHDTTCGQNLMDVGIAAQTLLLAAAEKGFGGCMIGSFKKKELAELLTLPEEIVPSLVIALGVPDEEIHLVEAEGKDTTYYRDENGVHYVPKRSLEEILL